MKCEKCGNVFYEGVFCPECGYKNESAESENEFTAENLKRQNINKEKAEQERIAKEKAEQERIVKEKAEQERIAREKAEQEKLARTYNGVVYDTEEAAKTAKKDNETIDLLKIKLEGTKSQEERQKIMQEFETDIQTLNAKKRMEYLRQKVNQPIPKSEKNNKFVGIISLIIFIMSIVVSIITAMVTDDADSIGYMISAIMMIVGIIGLIVWIVRKIKISIMKHTKDYYLNIKNI